MPKPEDGLQTNIQRNQTIEIQVQQEEQRVEEGVRDMLQQMQQDEQTTYATSHAQRLAQIRANCTVLMPEENVQSRSYAHRPAERIGSTKRKVKSKTLGSALRKKRLNAEAVEAARISRQNETIRRLEALGPLPENLQKAGPEELAQFLTAENQQILIDGLNDQGKLSDAGWVECYDQIMNINLQQIDLRNDAAIAAQSERLEDITAKTFAMRKLLDRNPEYMRSLVPEQRDEFNTQMDQLESVGRYYTARKNLITNPHYRTHYNSEIGNSFDVNDTAEQRQVTHLIWQVETYETKLSRDRAKENWMSRLQVEDIDQTLAQRMRQFLNHNPMDGELGKNNAGIEDSVHAEYFRQHTGDDDLVTMRLEKERYRVTGFETTMGESFVRHLANLPRWKAVQNMTPEGVREMVENLTRSPENAEDPVQIEEAKQANLAGLRTFKELIKKQMNYLERKYGSGFSLTSPEELIAHKEDLESDFTNMQGLSECVIYMKKLPGIFDPSDLSDQKMDQLLDYYQAVSYTEIGAQALLKLGACRNYSDYKRKSAEMVAMMSHGSAAGNNIAILSGKMHGDIRWNTPFNEE